MQISTKKLDLMRTVIQAASRRCYLKIVKILFQAHAQKLRRYSKDEVYSVASRVWSQNPMEPDHHV